MSSFEQSIDALRSFQAGHEIIVIDENDRISTRKKSCWLTRLVCCIYRFFTCSMHPAERVAGRIMDLFEDHQKKFNENHFQAIFRIGCLMGKSEVSTYTKQRYERFNSQILGKFKEAERKSELILADVQKKNKMAERKLNAAMRRLDDVAFKAQIKTDNAKKELRAAEDKAKQIEMSAQSAQTKAKAAAIEIQRSADSIALKIIADAEENAKRIQNEAQKSLNKTAEVQISGDWSHLLSTQEDAFDTVLQCRDGEEVFAHWAFLVDFQYFTNMHSFETETNKMSLKNDEEDSKYSVKSVKKSSQEKQKEADGVKPSEQSSIAPLTDANIPRKKLRTIDFETFSASTVKSFLQFIYSSKIPAGTTLEQLIDLYSILDYVGSKKHFKFVDDEIFKIVCYSPYLIFDVLPNLEKNHPVVSIFITVFNLHSAYNDWRDIPIEKREQLVNWILELEDPKFEKNRKELVSLNVAIAVAYLGHLGKVKDHEKTFMILEECSEKKVVSTQGIALLGICHLNGIGTPKDKDYAVRKFEQAVKSDSPVGRYFKGLFALRKEHDYKMTDAEILNVFVDSNIYPPAKYEAGKCFLRGFGSFKNACLAKAYFEEASKTGHLESLTELGKLLMREYFTPNLELYTAHALNVHEFHDIKFPPDKKLALQILSNAAARGEKEAQFLLGEAYEEGDVVDMNLTTAKLWYQKSAAQGYPDAVEAVARLG